MTWKKNDHSNIKLIIAQYLLDIVYNRERITRSEPVTFSVEDIIKWSELDLYKVTVARELRKLKAERLLNYTVIDRLKGKYALQLPLESEFPKNERYSRKRFFKMLELLIVTLESRIKPTLVSTVRKMLRDTTGNVSEASTTTSESSR